MELADIRRLLDSHRTELRDLGVSSLRVFGSVARGEAGPSSDIDLLVDGFDSFSLFRLVTIQDRLEQWLGTSVDLVTEGGLPAWMRDRVLHEAKDVA
ncbi:MAG: nucleotidyltransferase family protein [Phycisphaerales bacterium]|jgi:hypothetical protein|nr:nucleotidyltransferase family protein [Phycisphaerales bacterium]